MTRDQVRYATAIIRNLKKHRDATPFLHPVNHLNVPDYATVISHPMDLNTVEHKLINNNYGTVDDFIANVRLVFTNCYKFNGPEATISMLCQNVESAFEKGLRQMPPSKEELSPSLTNSPGSIDGKRRRQESSPVTTNNRRISEDHRQRREIHPPPSKDYPETWTKKPNPKINTAELKFCGQAIKEMKKGKYKAYSYPFLVPVDYVALNIPDYPTIVKHPMDLSTIERKWSQGEYATADEFEKDVRLMFNNCYIYNPPTLPVHQMARNLEKVFNEKWQHKPAPATLTPPPSAGLSSPGRSSVSVKKTRRRKVSVTHQSESEEDVNDDDDDDDSNDERIAELERHIASIAQQIQSMKSDTKKGQDSKQHRRRRSSTTTTTSKPVKKQMAGEKRKRAPATKPKPKRTQSSPSSLPEFTFEQKSYLSDRINNLTGDKLSTVVHIIQSSMPNLDGGQDEIVLDIDVLDRKTLHELHEFITGRRLSTTSSQPQSWAQRSRKRFSEADSNRKIKDLEQKLRRFEANDSSSGSDSSSSESDTDGSSDSD
ncbi:Bromodomain-containing protein [Chlamydoabsidia padenii]|nr:Bromodomain-containing protein [Chlamydoabsidia padenii]